ncbi:MAG: TVP38/TMEM64 family protein [Thiobacillus sp.]
MKDSRVIVKGLALILSLALLGYLFKKTDLGHSINEAWINEHVRRHGLQGVLLFLMMGAVFTAIGLPRQIIAFLGGYAFGVLQGTLFGALAALLGSVLAFSYARLFGRGLLGSKLGDRARRFVAFIDEHPFTMTLLLRLLPVGNNALINLAAGISNIRPLGFFSGSFIGYLPQTLVFALVGSGVQVAPGLKIGVAILLFIASGALGGYLYHRHRHALDLTTDLKTAKS